MIRPAKVLSPLQQWAPNYQRRDLRSDMAAGVTVGAMLIPQAMAYALLAGLPPTVGLYAATIPVVAYALFGSSRQLAVGPVAIVSLLTASALASTMGGEAGADPSAYIAAAAVLALLVGAIHLVLAVCRLGFLVNLLSHSVLVGFTAAAAIIIGFSQAKHVLGVSVERQEHFYETVREVVSATPQANLTTLLIGSVSLAALFALKKVAPRLPAALLVVAGSIAAVEFGGLQSRGVKVMGDIPQSLPSFTLPSFDGSLVGQLLPMAFVITLVGFMESIAVGKTYARRHNYEIDPNAELVGLGAANVASGLFGGYPVTGGFSRTAVNDTAGARTPLASIITATVVLASILFLTPLLSLIPYAALGAIIIAAVVGLFDWKEMVHIAKVKPTDLIGLVVAFVATLALGIELGIVAAVVASLFVVFARLSRPHHAVLGQVPGTSMYRNVDRFPEAVVPHGIAIVRIDAPMNFMNAIHVKRVLLRHAKRLDTNGKALVLDASGISDIDTNGAEALHDVISKCRKLGVSFQLADVKGPVRDVLRQAGVWDALCACMHGTTHDAVVAVQADRFGPLDQRLSGIDERPLQCQPV